MRAKRAAGDTKINNVPFRLKSPKWNAGIPPFLRKEWDKKKSLVHLVVDEQKVTQSEIANASHGVETRFSEFLAGVLSKGVWWMPRLKKAMKDVV